MSATELTPIDIRAYRDPPHVEALIGTIALRHRADILDRMLPEIRSCFVAYEAVLRCCFFDAAAKVEAMRRLGDVLRELDRLNTLMCSSSFSAGEA